MAANRVKFGLKNVHYAIVTETLNPGDGTITSTYGAGKAWPGAVNLTIDAAGSDDTNFDADDGIYYVIAGRNNGYTGTFESAIIPEDVEVDVLGHARDDNGVIVENKDDIRKYIAFMFEVNGDTAARRYLFYRCMLNRNSVNASTISSDGATPQTDTVNITIAPRPDDGLIKTKTGASIDSTVYNNWFKSVYIPSVVADRIILSQSTITIGDTDTAVIEILANRDSLYENMTATVTEGAAVDADLSFDNKNVIITALAAGTAVVTVASGDASATITITVED